jgi:hypothetical protein
MTAALSTRVGTRAWPFLKCDGAAPTGGLWCPLAEGSKSCRRFRYVAGLDLTTITPAVRDPRAAGSASAACSATPAMRRSAWLTTTLAGSWA